MATYDHLLITLGFYVKDSSNNIINHMNMNVEMTVLVEHSKNDLQSLKLEF